MLYMLNKSYNVCNICQNSVVYKGKYIILRLLRNKTSSNFTNIKKFKVLHHEAKDT